MSTGVQEHIRFEKAQVPLRFASPRIMGSVLAIVVGTSGLAYTTLHLATPESSRMLAQLAPPAPGLPATPRKAKKRRLLFSGIASWYGEVLDGHTTASGEVFHKDELTACHRTLPFGTLVRVINLHNHKSVVVRITDRGVLFPNRVIDLSSAAAMQIGMLGMARGRTRVRPGLLLAG